MGILDGILNVVTGNFAKEAIGAIEKYFPPDMSPEQKTSAALAMENFALQKQRQFDEARAEAENLINTRIAMYEGSASDLKAVPFLGAFLLLLRGSQRIAWGFGALVLDFKVFSGSWTLTDPTISNSFWVVNFLVLGFLFGERAVTNVLPFITNMIQARK